MSNFKQFDHKNKHVSSVKPTVRKAEQQWLEERLQNLQMVEKYNQLIKKLFLCKKCGKKITNTRWVHIKDPKYPNNYSKISYYHSKRQCNPNYINVCLYCGKSFLKNRKNQKLCSKKCSVKYMTSPIIIKRCATCGKEFKTRMLKDKPNTEKYCTECC